MTMTFVEFKDYCRAKYIGYKYMLHPNKQKNLIDFLLCNKDPWFHAFGSVYYILHILGLEIVFSDNKYSFYSSNTSLIKEILHGERLLSVNGYMPNDDRMLNYEGNDLKIKLEKNTKIEKNVCIQVPILVGGKAISEFIECENKKNLYLCIESFETANNLDISALLSRCKTLTIDLRNCTGGPINEMLKFLKHFAKNDFFLKFLQCETEPIVIKVSSSNETKIAVDEIDFLVSEHTASSAEIFCLTLRQHYKNFIFGKTTKGKLVVQKFISVEKNIIAVPVFKYEKPEKLFDCTLAYYDGDKIVPDSYVIDEQY